MQPERKLFPVEDPADPHRCQGPGMRGEGQCPNYTLEGMQKRGLIDDGNDYTGVDSCPAHGGFAKAKNKSKSRAKMYRLQVWQERVDELSESEKATTLREEIGVVRMLTETILVQCKNQNELVMYSSKIADLVMKTEKLVSSCNRLEQHMGMTLDRAGALVLAGKIVQVIQKHVTDGEAVDEISNGIIDAITTATQGASS